MAQWGAFAALTGLLLAVLLVLARTSQDLIREEFVGDERDPGGSDPDEGVESGIAPSSPGNNGTSPSNTNASPSDGEDSRRQSPASDLQPLETSSEPAPSGGSRGPSPRPPEEGATVVPDGRAANRGSSTPDLDLTTGALLANVALTQGVFGSILLAGAWYFEIPARAFGVTAEPGSTGVLALALGLGFGLALWVGSEASASFADAVGATYDERLRGMLAPASPGGWVVLLGVVLPIIAFVEELLFRAAAIGAINAGFAVSPWALAIVSSVAFGFAHGAQGRVGIAVTGLLGFALAAGYVLTGSLLVVVVAHYVVNATEFVVHEYFDVDRLWN